MTGLVIRNTGSAYDVLTDEGATVTCRPKGNFRLKGIRTTNPVAVGDRVEIADNYIVKILPRRNYIVRRASNLSKEAHILASNIDQTLLIISLIHPSTATTFIDRFLATAEAYAIPAIIVINKTDLLDTPELQQQADDLDRLYTSVGYKVVRISAKEEEGLEPLREILQGKITLFSGNSGVGKSTLINDLIPGADIRTAPVSVVHDTGMHTTTFSRMYDLPGGGYIIDTPGVKGFGTIDFNREEVSHFFPEIFKTSAQCRYGNCTHTCEPGCAVLGALERGEINPSRYTSYLSILEDSDNSKYRKPQ